MYYRWPDTINYLSMIMPDEFGKKSHVKGKPNQDRKRERKKVGNGRVGKLNSQGISLG